MRVLARLTVLLLLAGFVPCAGAQPLLPEASRLSRPPGIALVLSGGGAKGFSHIGVLEVLDSAHIPIDLIVGTSIGSAIGGLYAAGYTPQQLERFADSVNWLDVLDLGGEGRRNERSLNQKDADNALLSLRFTGFFHPVIPQAISSGQRLTMLLNSMVMGAPNGVPHDFLRDMRVPFIAVTTDIVKGERHLISSGDLTEALRASATLPLRFDPLPEDSVILMDGGLIANIPVDVARSVGASRVIVSNATAPLKSRDALNTPWDVADQVISLMMQRQNNEQLKNADLVIDPKLVHTETLDASDFTDIPALVEAGREAARAMLPAIRAAALAVNDPPPVIHATDTLLLALQRVRFIGTTPRAFDSSLAKLPPYGMPLVVNGSEKDVERSILQNYRMRGYSLARIDSVVVHPSLGRADYYIDEGRIADVVTHSMNDRELVLHELPFSSGEIFQASEGEQALKNLNGTGLFDFTLLQVHPDSAWPGTRYIVRNDTTYESAARIPRYGSSIIVTTHSQPANVVRLGVLANNEIGAEFSAEIANENLSGSGGRIALKGGIGPITRYANFSVEAPNLFHNIGVFGLQAYSGYRDITVYSGQMVTQNDRIINSITDVVRELRDWGVQLRAGGQIERLGSLIIEARAEHQRWFSVRDSNELGDLQLRALRAQLTVDSRNDAAYPHHGTLLRAYAESGLQILGGTTSYTKIFGELQQAIPLSNLHTLIPRFRAGFGDSPLPRLEQFFLGGMESFYGLNEYELRGKQMLEGSLTYQIAIPHALYFPTFVSMRYDLGAVWPEPEAIKFETLVHGLGAQVGLKTPLGLARFGIGENFRFVQVQHHFTSDHILALNTPRFYFSIGSRL